MTITSQRPCLHLTADSQLRCPGCGREFTSEQEWCAVSDAAIAAWHAERGVTA